MTPDDTRLQTIVSLAVTKLEVPFEGFSATPYRDPAGVWTIGFGSTRDALQNPVTALTAPVTRDQAMALAERDTRASVDAVGATIHVPLTINQEAALVDFIYNLGAGNFAHSQVFKKLSAGDYAGAAADIDQWDYAGGHPLAGLLRRRQAETDLFNTP